MRSLSAGHPHSVALSESRLLNTCLDGVLATSAARMESKLKRLSSCTSGPVFFGPYAFRYDSRSLLNRAPVAKPGLSAAVAGVPGFCNGSNGERQTA
jgi:hypothetical protein